MPTGGPKDVSPPVLIDVFISGDLITAVFDENISIKNQAGFYCSPPLTNLPEISTKRNLLKIQGSEDWETGPVRSLFFQGVIGDYNEGNLLSDLTILSSNKITKDTLKIKGVVKDCISSKSQPEIWVLLYVYNKSDPDSLLGLSNPDYIARTNKDGQFVFPNLRDTLYSVFALSENYQTLKYSLPQDDIGFYDEFIEPEEDSLILVMFNESSKSDTLNPLVLDSTMTFGRLIVDSLPKEGVFELLTGDRIVSRVLNQEALIIDSLPPKTYRARVFIDKNNNGMWDTGNLKKRSAPEEMRYYSNNIKVRSNWDVQIVWEE